MSNTEWDTSDDHDLKATEGLLAYAWKSLESAGQHFTRIDTKAASLAGFVGVSATVLVAVSRAAFPASFVSSCLYITSRFAFFVLLGSLFAAFAFCLLALYPRRIVQLPRIPRLVGIFIRMDADKYALRQLQKHIINQVAVTEGSIYEATRAKERWLQRAAIALWSALAFAIISSLSYIADTTAHPDAYRDRLASERRDTTAASSTAATAAK
jgi:hypothetical protein